MQKPFPVNVTGVEVVLSVLDPNNNYYDVGKTTSDATGNFVCEFTPEVPRLCSVIATFAGSKAYYGSFAETYLKVNEAPVATPEFTPTPASVADMYFLPVSAGMIVAIIIVLALLVLLLLRKRYQCKKCATLYFAFSSGHSSSWVKCNGDGLKGTLNGKSN
jgi:hypothetical protein